MVYSIYAPNYADMRRVGPNAQAQGGNAPAQGGNDAQVPPVMLGGNVPPPGGNNRDPAAYPTVKLRGMADGACATR